MVSDVYVASGQDTPGSNMPAESMSKYGSHLRWHQSLPSNLSINGMIRCSTLPPRPYIQSLGPILAVDFLDSDNIWKGANRSWIRARELVR